MQAPPRLMLEMVPSHVADPTVIVAGRVVGIRGEWRRSCCGLPGTAVGTGAIVALFVSGASAGGAAETAIGSGSISKGGARGDRQTEDHTKGALHRRRQIQGATQLADELIRLEEINRWG